MWIIAITHASTREVPSPSLKALSEAGREQIKTLAQQFRDLVPNTVPLGENLKIDRIVTSPLARCVETAVLFADELREFTQTGEVQISARIKARKGAQLSPEELLTTIKEADADCLVLSLHADLAGALPAGADVTVESENGWFKTRPVLAVLNYDPAAPWENARLLHCATGLG